MKSRLIRALQRGGVTAEVGSERWGVWRSRDRRGRIIGVLTGADIDVLRVRESLKPLGESSPTILVWSESVLDTPHVAPSARQLEADEQAQNGSLLERLLTRTHDPELRQLIRETARRYRADVERASAGGPMAGMNWDGLALGGKVDGGQGFANAKPLSGAQSAQAVQKILRDHLGGEKISFLDRLILRGESRSQLIKTFGGQPSLMEGQAMAAVRALHDVYLHHVRDVR